MVTAMEGLQWRKADLHMHTPASKDDYKDLSATASEIIQKAIDQQLDVLCVCDHNSGRFVDKLKVAAQGTRVTVFPGVEITAQGGERNVHILAILDPSKGEADVNDLLSQLKITEAKRGRTDILARGDVNEVIETIAGCEGIPILAHADSGSGVLEEIRGIARTEIIKNVRLLGAHITKDSTVGFLDGSDPNYQRKLAVIKASDAHSLDEIGETVSYLKMGALTASSLRQCLNDPDTRIKFSHDAGLAYPSLISMECTQSFLAGQRFQFHSGLNSIIGGKGVGKSLIIEFLRFVLAQPSDIKPLREDMEGKLSEQLGLGGNVIAHVQTQAGALFRVVRQYDGLDNPITVHNVTEDAPYEGDVRKLLPIMVYSQNEIVDIARDPSAQRKLIDKLIDIEDYNAPITESQGRLEGNINQYVESLRASEQVAALTQDIETNSQQVKELDGLLGDPMFAAKKKWDRRQSLLKSDFEKVSSLDSETEQFIEDHRDLGFPSLKAEDEQLSELASAHQSVKDAADKLVESLSADLTKFRNSVAQASKRRERFDKTVAKWLEEYERFVATAGGDLSALARKRARIQAEIEKLKEGRKESQKKADRLQEADQKRQDLLDSLEQAVNSRYQARADTYRDLTERSMGKLKMRIQRGADRASYRVALNNLVQGTGARSQNLDKLVGSMEPREFVAAVLSREYSSLTAVGDFTGTMATKIIGGIVADQGKMRDLLCLPFRYLPEDVPSIEFLKEDGGFAPLGHLSVGQKCTALLLIALSEGMMPIIVDQPEDALDVATVYYDVVARLRAAKERRQFILTTHNPNIAVASDSDKYHVLKSTEAVGEIVCCGAIDLEDVRDAVINQLEGGIDPYALRGKKYELP